MEAHKQVAAAGAFISIKAIESSLQNLLRNSIDDGLYPEANSSSANPP